MDWVSALQLGDSSKQLSLCTWDLTENYESPVFGNKGNSGIFVIKIIVNRTKRC